MQTKPEGGSIASVVIPNLRVQSFRLALRHAARLLEEDAKVLRESYTVDGVWDEDESDAKRDHDRRMVAAAKLWQYAGDAERAASVPCSG